uniref:Uncharacterized protein n=1 Tax=Cacopsylla melanoneura TaxID=428564 RepID=A0A8D8XJ82_9HEMI
MLALRPSQVSSRTRENDRCPYNTSVWEKKLHKSMPRFESRPKFKILTISMAAKTPLYGHKSMPRFDEPKFKILSISMAATRPLYGKQMTSLCRDLIGRNSQ